MENESIHMYVEDSTKIPLTMAVENRETGIAMRYQSFLSIGIDPNDIRHTQTVAALKNSEIVSSYSAIRDYLEETLKAFPKESRAILIYDFMETFERIVECD